MADKIRSDASRDLSRRRFLTGMAGSALVVTSSAWANTPDFPSRPIRIVVAWPPGSATDLSARMIADHLSRRLGQSVIVENRSGASGIIGSESVLQSPPDGYTLLFTTSNHASNKLVFPKMSFDPQKSFDSISRVYRGIITIAVHPSLPVANLNEFIEYGKKGGHALSYGTPGLGTPHHLAGELFKRAAGIDMEHIPYRGGGPSMVDLIGGQIPVAFASLAAVLPALKREQVKVLALTRKERYSELPDVPTVDERFPGFDVSGWAAMFAPAGTPRAVIDRLNREVVAVLELPEMTQALHAGGVVAWPSEPRGLDELVAGDIDKWTQVVASGVRLN